MYGQSIFTPQPKYDKYSIIHIGGVAEWLKAPVSKTGIRSQTRIEGSNPSPSAGLLAFPLSISPHTPREVLTVRYSANNIANSPMAQTVLFVVEPHTTKSKRKCERLVSVSMHPH